MKTTDVICTLLVSLLTCSNFTGCSVVGYFSGLRMDERSKTYSIDDQITISGESYIQIISYVGDTTISKICNENQLTRIPVNINQLYPPFIVHGILRKNSRIEIASIGGKKWEGELLRITRNTIKLNWEHNGIVSPIDMPLENITSLKNENLILISKDTLISWVHDGRIPSDSVVVISNDSCRVTIPFNVVKSIIIVDPETHYALARGIFGLCLDAIMVYYAFNIHMRSY